MSGYMSMVIPDHSVYIQLRAMACEFHVPCFLPCTEVVDLFNDTMNRCCDALKAAKADHDDGNLKSSDVDNRKIYLKELNKCIGGASVLMRASYDDGDAGSSTSSGLKANDSIVKLSIVDGEKIKTTVADLSKWDSHTPIQRSEYPNLKTEHWDNIMNKGLDCIKCLSLQLSALEDSSDTQDPFKVFIPYIVMNMWQKNFADEEPDHQHLAVLQENWRRSFKLYTTILKAAKAAAVDVTGHIDSCKRAAQELCFVIKSCITFMLNCVRCSRFMWLESLARYTVVLQGARLSATVLQGASYSAVLQGAR